MRRRMSGAEKTCTATRICPENPVVGRCGLLMSAKKMT